MEMSTRLILLPAIGIAIGLSANLAPASADERDALFRSVGIDATATPLDEADLQNSRGAGVLGFLGALIAALPPGNTVVANINGTTTTQSSLTAPVSLAFTQGGTTVNLAASGSTATARVWMSRR